MLYSFFQEICQLDNQCNFQQSSIQFLQKYLYFDNRLVALEYDALGQLKKKTLAPAYSASGLDTLTNLYNIRGWVTAINKGYLEGTSDAWFAMELGYDRDGYATFANKQYNGNISATIWRTRGDGEKRKYDFSYDAVNRLLKADFKQKNGSNWDISAGIDFSMKIGNGTDPPHCL